MRRYAAARGGGVLALVGEAGMGKSRLVREFVQHRLPPGWRVLEAFSVSYGKATPVFPVIELLKGYFFDRTARRPRGRAGESLKASFGPGPIAW